MIESMSEEYLSGLVKLPLHGIMGAVTRSRRNKLDFVLVLLGSKMSVHNNVDSFKPLEQNKVLRFIFWL